MKVVGSVAFGIALFLGSTFIAYAAEESFSPFLVACTTGPTHENGSRQDCQNSARYTAPKGYVIIENRITVDNNKGRNERRCNVRFEGYVEVIAGTGITQPTVVVGYGDAVSPGGIFNKGAKADLECYVSGFITKLP